METMILRADMNTSLECGGLAPLCHSEISMIVSLYQSGARPPHSKEVLVLDSVTQHHTSVAQLFAIRQFQIDLLFHLVEQRNARAQQYRMNADTNLVD